MNLDEIIETLVALALEEDLHEVGDITSSAILPPGLTICGRVTAKADGVIAGLPVARSVYARIDPQVDFEASVEEGTHVTPGTLICTVRGAGRSVLSGERTALNFMQRLSGIATLTAQFVAATAGTRAIILDTRKTTPGWRLLEKYAVRMGGGHNHRMGLYDEVLIKDNHISAAGGIRQAVERVKAHTIARKLPVVVEVETFEQLDEALALPVTRILLDNMDAAQMRRAVEITAGRVPLEASGNMNLERVADVAATGVDFISVGALTHSAPAFDLSMRLE